MTAAELHWIAHKLGAPDLFCGVTDAPARRARVRARILALDVADAVIGKRDGVPETWAQFFERQFGEPLGEPPDA